MANVLENIAGDGWSKKGVFTYLKISDRKNLCIYFLLVKNSGFEQFLFFKKTIAIKRKEPLLLTK